MNPGDSLSKLLRTWTYEPPPDPDFHRSVWTRIQTQSAQPAAVSRRAPLLAFPLAWNSAVAAGFAILLSAAAGSAAAVAYDHVASEKKMAALYARSIDPLQMSGVAASVHHHAQ